eukprot:jgi/Chlat1/4432/Chrsp29S04561
MAVGGGGGGRRPSQAVVVTRFAATSAALWCLPLCLFFFLNGQGLDLLSASLGFPPLDRSTKTTLSGVAAVVSVNVVIAWYVAMAMRTETPSGDPRPDASMMPPPLQQQNGVADKKEE